MSMTEAEDLLTEVRNLERKVADARRIARTTNAADHNQFDLRMLEQELLALRQRLDHTPHGTEPSPAGESPDENTERKLDSALSDSFPGSDAVPFLEPTPYEPTDSH
jgi:hypothetical protein